MAIEFAPGVFPIPLPVEAVSLHANLSQLPSCAIPCVAESCPTSLLACLCGTDATKEDVDSCILASCTLPEALFSRNTTESVCGTAVRDDSIQFNMLNVALGAVTAVVVGTRILFRLFGSTGGYRHQHRLGADDWTCLLALLLGIPSTALMIFGLAKHGLGRDVWGLSLPDVTTFGIYFYVLEMMYVLLMALVKLTLSLFYLDIFSESTTLVRRLLWGTVVFQVAFALAFVVKVIFQCTPVSYYWTKFDLAADPEGHCIDMNASGWANAAIGVAVDIWLLAIPLTQVRKLNLHWKKKAGAVLMFMTGALVTVVSILRFQSIVYFASTTNPTWDQRGIVWWSTIEVNVGIVCTCMPSMRLVLLRLSPRVFGSGSSVASYTDPGSRHADRPRHHDDLGITDEEHGMRLEERHLGSTTELCKTPAVVEVHLDEGAHGDDDRNRHQNRGRSRGRSSGEDDCDPEEVDRAKERAAKTLSIELGEWNTRKG